jgi:hypothetical protein
MFEDEGNKKKNKKKTGASPASNNLGEGLTGTALQR